ncbi:MAG: CheY-like chemotaxis protein [Bradymonadia bacterium]|jgi:CheY-like chemotaxis protein
MLERAPLILVAEDDEADVLLLQTAARRANLASELRIVRDGVEVVEYLSSDANTRPYLVVLDLNMPRLDGKGTLERIRAKAETRHLPVIMMSTSNSEDDVRGCLEEGANAFLVKPANVSDLVTKLRALEDFWRATRPARAS